MNKIVIDSTSFSRRFTGIEFYGNEVCRLLYKKVNIEKSMIVFFLFHKYEPNWFKETKYTKCFIYKGNSKVIMEQLWIPYIVMCLGIKKVYFPVFPPSLFFAILKVLYKTKIYRTVFDAIMWRVKSSLSIKNRLYMKPLETIGMHYYYKVFTISDFSKNDLILRFPRCKNKVINAYLGIKEIDIHNTDESKNNNILEKYSFRNKKFLLFVGTIEPRKNIEFLLEILEILVFEKLDIKLVIVGRKGWGYEKLIKHKLYKILKNHILITDFIPDNELYLLYKKALAFIFPSKYEGFGLPVVEAMKYGCPTISANNTSIPEAVDNSGILVNGWNPVDWKEEILKLYYNEQLRENLKKRGIERANKMKWEKTVNIIYQEIKNGGE